MSTTSTIDNQNYYPYTPLANNTTNSNNYYSSSYGTNFYSFTNVSTFTNNYIILAAGGQNGVSVNNPNPASTQQGGHAIINNSGNTITNLFNYGALLGGGGGGGGNPQGGNGGKGGAGGGGGAAGFYGGGDGGSLIYAAGLNGSFGGGGGPYQQGGGTYGGARGGAPGGSNYGGSAVINTFGFIYGGGAGDGFSNGGAVGSGGGYGGGNGLVQTYGSGGGGGGGRGGNGSGSYPGGNGGYSVYNNGTITNLTNGQGGTTLYYYGPCFYAGNAPTNYYINIQSTSRYGQLFCTGWASTSGTINFNIDTTSTISSSATLYYVLVGVTPTQLSGRSVGSLYGYLWTLTPVVAGSSIFGVYAYHLDIVIYQIYNRSSLLSTNALNTSYYRHVALTISGNIHTLYLDGSAVAINTNALNIFQYYPSTISKLLIGSAADLSYGYTGIIDDFKLWNRALPASDISAIYSSFTPSVPQNLTLIGTTSYSVDISFSMTSLTNNISYSVILSPSAITTVTGNNTLLNISGLASNTTYTVKVVASNGSLSSISSLFSFTTTTTPLNDNFIDITSQVTTDTTILSSNNGFGIYTNSSPICMANSGKYMFICTVLPQNTIFISTNYGTSFTNISFGITISNQICGICCSFDSMYVCFISTIGSIYLSTNYGSSWNDVGSSIGNKAWCSVSMSSTGQYICALVSNGSIYLSTNYGSSWNNVGSSIGNKSWRTLSMSSTGQYICALVSNGSIYLSTNYASSWNDVGSSIGNKSWSSVSMSSTGQYIICSTLTGTDNLFVNNNYGNALNWIYTIQNKIPSDFYYTSIGSDGLYQLTTSFDKGILYYSNNYGASFVKSSINNNNIYNISGICISGNGRYILVVTAQSSATNKVYLSQI
jgi:hypothetical protein